MNGLQNKQITEEEAKGLEFSNHGPKKAESRVTRLSRSWWSVPSSSKLSTLILTSSHITFPNDSINRHCQPWLRHLTDIGYLVNYSLLVGRIERAQGSKIRTRGWRVKNSQPLHLFSKRFSSYYLEYLFSMVIMLYRPISEEGWRSVIKQSQEMKSPCSTRVSILSFLLDS